MLCAVALSLVLAAPPAGKVYVKDVEFALKELEKQCGHFFKLKGIKWAKVSKEMRKAAKKVKSREDHWVLLTRLIARLRDGHAHVRLTKATQGLKWPLEPLGGPRVYFFTTGKKVYVRNAWGNADSSGVKSGMEVVKIDGQPARKWLDHRVGELRDLFSYSTEQQALFSACHLGPGGPFNSRLKLELRRTDGKQKKATLMRTSKSFGAWGPVVFPKGLKQLGKRNSYGRLESGCGYIHLRDVPGDLPALLDQALGELDGVDGLILDCRANGGGGVDHDAVFGRFVPPGKTLSFGKKYASAGANPYVGPMVVIVNAGCVSAGETISGMFKEDGRAYMIGESATAGMSSQKTTIELPSGLFSLYVSVRTNKGRFNRDKGIEGIGVPPHEVVELDPKGIAAGEDTLIARAEELLKKGFPKNTVPYKPERFGWKKRK